MELRNASLGEFEQTILLVILGDGDSAFALEVRREIEEETGRRVSRGAFCTTLERLERKGAGHLDLRSSRPTRGGGKPIACSP